MKHSNYQFLNSKTQKSPSPNLSISSKILKNKITMFIMGDKPVNKILQNMKTSPSVIDYLLKDWNDIEVLPIITREEFIVLLEGSAQLFSDTLTTEDDDIDKYIYEITVDKYNVIIELEYQFIKHKRSTFFCLYKKRADYVKNNNINYWEKYCMIDLALC